MCVWCVSISAQLSSTDLLPTCLYSTTLSKCVWTSWPGVVRQAPSALFLFGRGLVDRQEEPILSHGRWRQLGFYLAPTHMQKCTGLHVFQTGVLHVHRRLPNSPAWVRLLDQETLCSFITLVTAGAKSPIPPPAATWRPFVPRNRRSGHGSLKRF